MKPMPVALAYAMLAKDKLSRSRMPPFPQQSFDVLKDGMVKSQEIFRVAGKIAPVPKDCIQGSRAAEQWRKAVDSPAARDLVKKAMARSDKTSRCMS